MEKQSTNKAQQFNEKRFTKIDMIKTEHSTAFVLNFLPGQEVKPHKHPGQELYLHIFEGNGTLSVDGEEMEIIEGDVIHCSSDEKMGFVNTSADNVSIYGSLTKI